MSDNQQDMDMQKLPNVPRIDGVEYRLALVKSADSAQPDAYIIGINDKGDSSVMGFIDGKTYSAYRCDHLADAKQPNPRDAAEEPLVKLVGTSDDKTGQIVIKQVEGHWRRYSRWDRLDKAPATQPTAVVRTLPQCGCGGYLGAPMMFDSFMEMMAYFFIVFSDAESVNAKHAAILNGGACSI